MEEQDLDLRSECFAVTVEGGVAHLVMNRPDAYNSMTPAFWGDLPRIVDALDARGDVRVLVISAEGKHFSAGMDLAVFTGEGGLGGDPGTREPGRRGSHMWMLVQHLQESFTCLDRARFPVLVAVHGGCIGGAVDMVTAADCRYASADAFFCIQEINLGMTADVGTLQRLPKLIPEGVARQWAYTGERVPAARAAEVGLVNEVFADRDSLVAGVLEIARTIAAKSPLAIWGTKEMVAFTRDHSVQDSLRYVAGWQSGMFHGSDMMEQFGAKAEGRDPTYDDLPPRPSGA